MNFRRDYLLFLLGSIISGIAEAHVFSQPYSLPIPFVYYAGGAAAALVVSFALLGMFAARPAALEQDRVPRDIVAFSSWIPGRRSMIAGSIGVSCLAACIATGSIGTRNPYANLSMTLFWIFFVLALPYAVAIFGDFYELLNPWRALTHLLEAVVARKFDGVLRDPGRFGYAPSIVLYMAFICLELFGEFSPRGLANALLAYTAANLAGALLWGTTAWFRYGEFFGVFMRLLGRMSMVPRGWSGRGVEFRWPLTGLSSARADRLSLVVFILFMLSSTAFDGIHGTQVWVRFFFGKVYPYIEPLLTGTEREKFSISAALYYVWQWLALILSPALYFVALVACCWMVRRFAATDMPVREIILRFALSLLPIVIVYHVTHYYALLLSQGPQIVRLVSDPFGFGWDLWGTADHAVAPIMIGAATLWISQVALILSGHVAGVCVAHVDAIRTFRTRRAIVLSQVPLLVLMVLLTVLGLWILSLPLA